ncbi:MAG: hypothetical protein ACREN3_04890, partial [Gemmatimonadaceae bacterium]
MPQPESERPGVPGMITPLSTPSIPGMSRDGLTFPLAPGGLDALVRSALEEDGAFNDITTIATVVTGRHARASLVARQAGVVAGIPLVVESFRLLDPKVSIRL